MTKNPENIYFDAGGLSLLLAILLLFSAPAPATGQVVAVEDELTCSLKGGFFRSILQGTGNSFLCAQCPAGSFCPNGQLQSTLCLPGTFQSLVQQEACLPCPENFLCSGNGTKAPAMCPDGRTNPYASTSSTCSSECTFETHYLNSSSGLCVLRKVALCNLETHYEVPTVMNRTQERTCRPLTQCRTGIRLAPTSPVLGSP